MNRKEVKAIAEETVRRYLDRSDHFVTFQCAFCGKETIAKEVHHIIEETCISVRKEKTYITCMTCHNVFEPSTQTVYRMRSK